MAKRLNYVAESPELFKKLSALSMAIHAGGNDSHLRDLVNIRASQMNGCAFCLDMHVKEATIHGERPLRLHHVAIWRESNLFSDRERAAFAWTEALTRIDAHGVSDEVFAEARAHFSDKELTELTYAIMVINAWNRLNVAFLNEPGSADKDFGLDKAGLN